MAEQMNQYNRVLGVELSFTATSEEEAACKYDAIIRAIPRHSSAKRPSSRAAYVSRL